MTDGTGTVVATSPEPIPTVDISILQRQVAMDVRGCPSRTVASVLRDVISEWCQRTWCVNRSFTVKGHGAAASDFGSWKIDFSPYLDGFKIFRIGELSANGQPLRPVERDVVAPVQTDLFSGRPNRERYFRILENGKAVRIHPVSDADTLLVELVLEPTEAAEVPDILRKEYQRAIIAGAKARLMEMADVPWSSPGMAAHHFAIHEAARSSAVGKRARQRQQKGKHFI